MWYPGFTFTTSRFIHNVASAMFHFLPAFIVDLALRFKGGKPIMMKLTRRFERAAKTGEFFTVNEWRFHGENMQQLAKSVKAANDANNFNVDIATLDWDNYVQQYMLGIRKYILNDSPDTLTNARSRISKCVKKINELI
ncbi:hypothetical protein PV325_005810 [Microctonus aethiopoides]|nr:hypothetical protein PV325_005810 [Microctonus aethiopoides]KAK0092114.1 hypothetical protein PV326_002175 [Microctonus aethiopoides]